MSNITERRALATEAVRLWDQLNEILADIRPGANFWNTSSAQDWGLGAWMVYSELSSLRTAAKIMGFRLGLSDIEAFKADPKPKDHKFQPLLP